MKKLVLPFLLIALFLFKIDSVQAITGKYTFDINSVSYDNIDGVKNMKLIGWAYITNGDGNIHNVQPTYTLTLEATTASGAVLQTKTYYDQAAKPSYSNKKAEPNDFSKAYFSRYTDSDGNVIRYPDAGALDSRGNDLRAMRIEESGNPFAINLDFEFNVPFDDLDALATVDTKKIYMYLTSEVGGGKTTVYGKEFNTPHAKQTKMKIGIQKNRVTDTLVDRLSSLKEGVTFNFKDIVNEVTVVVTNAQGRPGHSLDSTTYYYRSTSGSIVSGWDEDYSSLYYYNADDSDVPNAKALATYEVEKSTKYSSIAASNQKAYWYQVRVSIGSARCYFGGSGSRYCLRNNLSSSTLAWIPSYWVTPIAGVATYIETTITQTCATYTSCRKSNLGSGTTCPKTECCASTCAIDANKGTYFCTNICSTPIVDPCSDITDPEKSYCCHYPTDSVCQKGDDDDDDDGDDDDDDDGDDDDDDDDDGGGFPTESPTNLPDTCKEDGTTTVKFKYPAEGWGKKLVSNDACTISCQETLRATFQPSQSVRAGMGFTYPVNINSSRSCTAAYDNDGWQSKLNTAATSATTAYDNMVTAVNQAKSLDTACGTRRRLTSTPTCPSGGGSRSGMTCSGYTCHRSVFVGIEPYACPGFGSGPISFPSVCFRAKYRDESYSCTKAASCPSGYSYESSSDTCARYVCSSSGQLWSTAQSAISSKLSTATSYRNSYNSYASTVNRLNTERSTCDNYVARNPYSGATSTRISVDVPDQSTYTITSSSSTEDAAYEAARSSTAKAYAIYECSNRSYTAPGFVGSVSASSFSSTYCNYLSTSKTYKDFWNKKSDSKVGLEFTTRYYVQRYTGEYITSSGSGYEADGRKSYTDFYDPSESNEFSLDAINLGPNLPGIANTMWSIDPFTCQYNVNNLIFPPQGDDNYDLYGNVAFMYRQISLTDPFPDRNPGENWASQTSTINSIIYKGYSIYGSNPLYTISLTPSAMQGIRNNYGTSYGTFISVSSNPYKSAFVSKYIQDNTIVPGR